MRGIGLGVAVLAGLAATAAADDLAKPLRGKWTLDKAALVESAPAYQAATTPEQKKEIRDSVMQGLPDVVIEFGEAEVSFVAAPNAPPEKAAYRVLGVKEGVLQMEIVSRDAAGKETVDKTAAELKGEVLTLRKEGDPFVMVLRRTK